MKVKPSPFVTQVFSTTGASLASAVASIFVFRFLARGLGTASFGLFSLSNRAFNVLLPFVTLMMGLAMSWKLSRTPDRKEQNEYILAASCWIFLSVVFVWIVGIYFRDSLSLFFLGKVRHYRLWFATLASLSFFAFYSLLDGIYFGRSEIIKANLWQWALGILGPLAVVLWVKEALVYHIVFYLGALYALSLLPLIKIWIEVFFHAKNTLGNLFHSMRMLIVFSGPRALGGWLLPSLLFIGPYFATRLISYEEAGYLVLAQTVYRIVDLGSNAFASVVLSKAGSLIEENRLAYLKERVRDLIEMVFHLGLYLAVHLLLWSDRLVLLWLGDEYAAVSLRMQILIVGLIPYFAYVVLRPIIDACEFKALNALHVGISCVLTLLLAVPLIRMAGGPGLALATALGFVMLGILSLRYFRQFLPAAKHIMGYVIVNAVLALPLILMDYGRSLLPADWEMTAFVALETGLVLVYGWFLWNQKPQWIKEVQKRLVSSVNPEGRVPA